jgi:hypothetical protein
MATNTSALKTFAQQTRIKLVLLITTKLQYVLSADTAELRGYETQINTLREQIAQKGEAHVIEEVAYTWFNRVMALRFMDANEYNSPKVVTPGEGQMRPEILQDAMGGIVEDDLRISSDDLLLPEAKLYKKLLVASCNRRSEPMPFLFEHISDYTELLLPDDLLSEQSFVTDIRKGMSDEDCKNVELVGWLYQFYITDRKADAEKKKSKKGGLKSDEQAAATQLFTPHWIVRYMVENSLGRIWMTLHPDSPLINEMPYYIPTPEGQTDTIPDDIHSARDIRFLDPCMGSGHILVYAFDLLTKMYEEEGEEKRHIPILILENNLYGIDIDPRCVQLASFALTMKARAYFNRYLRRETVTPHVIALRNIDHDTIASAGNWDAKSLIWKFENVDTIGSLLKVTPEECAAIKVDSGIFGQEQQLMKTQAEYLSRGYHCVVTNPPYLGKGKCDELNSYILKEYPNSKTDTMATFMERCLDYSVQQGKVGMINMQSWMFLSSYESLRINLLQSYQIDSLLHLGAHAFDEIGGEVVQTATFILAKTTPKSGNYFRLINESNSTNKELSFLSRNNGYYSVQQSHFTKIPGNCIGYWLPSNTINIFSTSKFIGEYGYSRRGLQPGCVPLVVRRWHEVSVNRMEIDAHSRQSALSSNKKWFKYDTGGSARKWFGNYECVVDWENDGYIIKHLPNPITPSEHLYFKEGIVWSKICSGTPTFRYHEAGIIPGDASPCFFSESHEKLYIMGILNSPICSYFLNLLAPTLNIKTSDVDSIPCRIKEENSIKEQIEQNISISKQDWDAHETSWDFERNELLTVDTDTYIDNIKYQEEKHFKATGERICIDPAAPQLNSLKWRVEQYKLKWEKLFMQLHANEEELNRQFIEIYGLQDELTPDVPLNEITILQKGEISIEDNDIAWHDDVIIKQFISYLVGCFMGRYSVDRPGLIIASQGQDLSALGLQVDGLEGSPQSTLCIDDDGIVPIVQEEDFFADDMTQRIETAIRKLFGNEAFQENMRYIRSVLGCSLRDYFYKDYYNDHLQMYSVKGAKRPIYWLFSSKMGDKRKKGSFKALVYMHRIEQDTLSKLHADYVHPYLEKISHQLAEAEDQTTREDLSQAQRNKALKLAEEMREKVNEVRAFETQLVEMASHRTTIDLDDGVKANYPKYYPLVEPIKGLDSSNDD